MKKSYKPGILILLSLCMIGCISMSTDWAEPRESNSVLYVKRSDALASLKHAVKFYLNDQEVANLGTDQYVIIHVKPGIYEASFQILDGSGEEYKTFSWRGELVPKSLNEAVANFFFGWNSTAKFMEINTGFAVMRGNFQEEIDLTGTLSPL